MILMDKINSRKQKVKKTKSITNLDLDKIMIDNKGFKLKQNIKLVDPIAYQKKQQVLSVRQSYKPTSLDSSSRTINQSHNQKQNFSPRVQEESRFTAEYNNIKAKNFSNLSHQKYDDIVLSKSPEQIHIFGDDQLEYLELAENYQKLFSDTQKKAKLVQKYNMQSIIRQMARFEAKDQNQTKLNFRISTIS